MNPAAFSSRHLKSTMLKSLAANAEMVVFA